MNEPSSKTPLISKGWIQAVALVMLFGFFTMGLLAYYTYTDEPPIPAQIVDANDKVIFTGKDIIAGQQIFLKNGLMEYGSIFGHGAWLGPDYTADYLHRAAELTTTYYGGSDSATARQQTITDFKTNRYDTTTGVLTWSAAQVDAFQKLTVYYGDYFGSPTTKYGLRPNAITDPEQIRQLTAFFSWSAWAGSALRPHKNYSYTNNWPPESLVANYASADTMFWSVISLIALLGGIGLLLAAFGRWNFLGWHGREEKSISFRPPDEVLLTPAQRSCAWFFLVMALLFVMQALLGGAGEHYRADDHRPRTARPGRAFLSAAGRAGNRGVRQHGRRICRRLRLDSKRLVLVRPPGFHVSGSRPVLANLADGGTVLLGRYPVPWLAEPAAQ